MARTLVKQGKTTWELLVDAGKATQPKARKGDNAWFLAPATKK